MYKKLLVIFIFTSFIIAPAPFVLAQDYSEAVDTFTLEMRITEDNAALITERILYNFGDNEKRGIIREIPIVYELAEGDVAIDLTVVGVTDELGNPRPYVEEGYYYKSIRIGDPDVYITGAHWYVLTYTVKNLVNGFENYDEIYWNVTGNEWEVPIVRASADIYLPSGSQSTDQQVACYTGSIGSQEAQCGASVTSPSSYHFETTTGLYAGEGLSVVAGFSKGIVTLPTMLNIRSNEYNAEISINGEFEAYTPSTLRLSPGEYVVTVEKRKFHPYTETVTLEEAQSTVVFADLQKTALWIFIEYYLPFILFAIGLIIIIAFFYKYGKEPKGRGTIIAEYEAPDKLTPGEVGTIVDQRAHVHDLTSAILHFAVHGYIKIRKETKKKFLWGEDIDFTLVKLKGLSASAEKYENKIFDGVFGSDAEKGKEVKLSSLEKKFYTHLPGIKKSLYGTVIKKGYFKKNPEKVRSLYLGIGIATVFIANFISAVLWGLSGSFLYQLLLPIWGIVIIILSFWMPKRTKKGMLAYEKIIGLEDFLTVTAKERIKQMHSPKNFRELFEELLPYAIALEVTEEWAKQFEGLFKEMPQWFEGEKGDFDSMKFTRLLNNMNATTAKAMTVTPSPGGGRSGGYSGSSGGSSSWSGGSGFSGGYSGGGFGGGGGSSW